MLAKFNDCVLRYSQDEETSLVVTERCLDAIGSLCTEPSASEVMLCTSSRLATLVVELALGRAPTHQLRVSALHALASISGAESLGPDGSAGNAVLSDQVWQISMPLQQFFCNN